MTEDRVIAYTLDDVAEILQVHPRTVRRRVNSGEIESFRVGNKIRILHTDLMDYIERQKQAE